MGELRNYGSAARALFSPWAKKRKGAKRIGVVSRKETSSSLWT